MSRCCPTTRFFPSIDKERLEHLCYILICIALGVFIAYRVSHKDMWRVGSDSIYHTYQIKLLIEQIKQEKNPLLWGSWNWYWYCGYPFLKAYSPLYHFTVAFMSILLNLPPETCITITAYMFYPTAITLAYLLAYTVSKNKLASCLGACVYGSCANVTSCATSGGNLPYLPGLIFSLTTLLLIQKVIDTKGEDMRYIVGTALCISALTWCSMRHAMRIPYYMLILLVSIILKKTKLKSLLLLPIAILASSVSTIPIAYYLGFYGSPTFGPMLDPALRTPLKAFNFLTSPWNRGLGPLASSMLFASIVCLVWDTYKDRQHVTSNRFFSYMIAVLVAFLAYYLIFIVALVSNLAFFKEIIGKTTVGFLIPTTPVFTAYVFSKITSSPAITKKRIVALLTIMLFGSSYLILIAPYWLPPTHKPWKDAYQTIIECEQGSSVWFRIHHLPVSPSTATLAISFKIPSLDGWYWQGAINGIYKRGFLSSHTDNPDEMVKVLKVLNVKYIIIGTGKAYYSNLAKKYLNSNSVSLIYKDGVTYVFRIDDPYPILASTNLFIISEGDEIQAYRSIVIDDRFDPNLGIFLSRDNDLSNLPYKEWNGNFSDIGYVNVTLHKAVIQGIAMTIELTVDRDCYVSIPVAYWPCLKAQVDGQTVKTYKALPAFIALHVPKGTHTITIKRYVTPLELWTAVTSALTHAIALLILLRRKGHQKQ